jgi:beta-lactamase regulating signal transducer with metallopeptidase domain
MGAIWPIALGNAVLVAAGVPLVWAVGRFARKPALTHALAVILLLKLLTPPLWRVPVWLPQVTGKPEPAAVAVRVQDQPVVIPPESPQSQPDWMGSNLTEQSGVPDVPFSSGAPSNSPASAETARAQSSAVAPSHRAAFLANWRDWIIPLAQWVWIVGSLACAAVAAGRVVRFSRALRYATRAANLQPRANLLARRLGLRAAPPVWFVPGCVSPMLWSLGRSRLLLPQGLWDRLDVIERDTILLHELAHWRRGDPAVRWIELAATCLYWWHPACWWARRELREAEEQCCDAWVLWAMPGTFKNYANALLEAVEFVSVGADRPSARSAAPALASRMGQFVHLRRRLTMLKHGNIARALSWGGLAGVMTLGSFVLPVAPAWGQERPEANAPDQPGQVAPAGEPTDPFAAPGAEPQPRQPEAAQAAPAPAVPGPASRAGQDPKEPSLQSIEGMINSNAPSPPLSDREERAVRQRALLQLQVQQLEKAHAEADLERAAAHLKRAQQVIEQLTAQLTEAKARINELERRVGSSGWKLAPGDAPATLAPPPMPPLAPRAPAPMVVPVPPAGPQPQGRWEYRSLPGSEGEAPAATFGRSADSIPPAAGPKTPETRLDKTPETRLDVVPGIRDGQYRVIVTDPTTGKMKEIQTRLLKRPGAASDAGEAERLDKIEAELKMLMGEVERMRSAGPGEQQR